MPDATKEGVVPVVARDGDQVQYATDLDFDARQEWLASIPEEERTAMIEALPMAVRMTWINEERVHLEEQVKDQPVEGADFGADPAEVVVVPGSEEPQDRAPDVGAETIATLVQERIAAEQRANAAEAMLAKYRAQFGELPS